MGTGPVSTAATLTTIFSSTFNKVVSALKGDLVPRDSSGAAVDHAGSLGTSAYPWLKLFIGAAASGLSIEEDTGAIIFKIGGVKKFSVPSTGIDRAYLGPANKALSSSCGSFTSTATVLTDVTNLSQALTTNGRSVRIELVDDGSGSPANVSVQSTSVSNPQVAFFLLRDGSQIATGTFGTLASYSGTLFNVAATMPPSILKFIDDGAPAGAHTYKLQFQCNAGTTVGVLNCKLRVEEI